ncbi:MAG TPA: hypothetical protein PLE19_10205 [Planctomycetota bacterium]|nr:hypothetical protein [Planctomycetota bacterium]HRR80997.1 hypothetical protein [Planctomycetota bacterium]HRT93645.1 hypothetical protein [Planctomycetota bacterium]
MSWRHLAAALLCLVCSGWTLAAAEPARPADVTAEQLAEALKGFRGFLVGDVVERRETGATLFVRSITLVEGNQAKNPGILMGRLAAVQYATEKDAQGVERPMKGLVRLMQQLERLPAFAFGGGGGGNVMIMMDEGGGAMAAGGAGAVAGGGNVKMQRMIMKAATMRMNVNGMDIRLGDDDEDAEAEAADAAKPKGPVATLRVKAAADGTLVADRAMPGMQPSATWGGMPKVQFGEAQALEAVPAPDGPKREKGKDAQF